MLRPRIALSTYRKFSGSVIASFLIVQKHFHLLLRAPGRSPQVVQLEHSHNRSARQWFQRAMVRYTFDMKTMDALTLKKRRTWIQTLKTPPPPLYGQLETFESVL